MGWLQDYEGVERFASPRSVDQGRRQRGRLPGRFSPVSTIPGVLAQPGASDSVKQRFVKETVLLQSARDNPIAKEGAAGSPCSMTAPLVNHDVLHRSSRDTRDALPRRMKEHNMDKFCTSPRRQMNRGASCPPIRTDPITHAYSVTIDPLALRLLDCGHLTQRDRSLRRNDYPEPCYTGTFNLRTHETSSNELFKKGHTVKTSTAGLNSHNLTGAESLLPTALRTPASDIPQSTRYTKVLDRRDLTFIDGQGSKGPNPALKTSSEFSECLGQKSPSAPSSRPEPSPPQSEPPGTPSTSGKPPSETAATPVPVVNLFLDPLR